MAVSIKKVTTKPIFVFFLAWCLYFILFWTKALYLDNSGNFMAGHPIIWSDWAAHLTMTNAIEQRGLFIENPLLIGEPFRYPFATNALSALILRLGIPLIPAMVVPSFVSSILLIFSLTWWFSTLLRNTASARLATTFFMFSGGLGFLFALKDMQLTSAPLAHLANTSLSYTYQENIGLVAINVVHGMVIPQRAFALGMALGLIGLTLILIWWRDKQDTQLISEGSESNKSQNIVARLYTISKTLLPAGLLLGLLPSIHTHSFLAVFFILSCWACISILHKEKSKIIGWIFLVVLIGLLAIPQLHFLNALSFVPRLQEISLQSAQSVESIQVGSLNVESAQLAKVELTQPPHSKIATALGWMAPKFGESWLVFSIKNWGVVLCLAAITTLALGIKKTEPNKKMLQEFLPFWIIFILANVFSFQPYIWDNTKLLMWSYLGFCGLSAYAITEIIKKSHNLNAQQKYGSSKQVLILALLLVALSTASGSLDIYRILRHDLHKQQLSSSQDLELVAWVKNNTNLNSVWLTANWHTHWLFTLTGRQAVMTYPGWIWTHGFEYKHLDTLSRKIYESSSLDIASIKETGITHIVVGPHEKNQYKISKLWTSPSQSDHLKIIFQTETTKIFEVTCCEINEK